VVGAFATTSLASFETSGDMAAPGVNLVSLMSQSLANGP
jgi:hypothetical protein